MSDPTSRAHAAHYAMENMPVGVDVESYCLGVGNATRVGQEALLDSVAESVAHVPPIVVPRGPKAMFFVAQALYAFHRLKSLDPLPPLDDLPPDEKRYWEHLGAIAWGIAALSVLPEEEATS